MTRRLISCIQLLIACVLGSEAQRAVSYSLYLDSLMVHCHFLWLALPPRALRTFALLAA